MPTQMVKSFNFETKLSVCFLFICLPPLALAVATKISYTHFCLTKVLRCAIIYSKLK